MDYVTLLFHVIIKNQAHKNKFRMQIRRPEFRGTKNSFSISREAVLCSFFGRDNDVMTKAQQQHFRLYTVKSLISLVLLPISKVYQIRSLSKLLVNPIFLLKSEGKRGLNEEKLLCKISKIHEECLPH